MSKIFISYSRQSQDAVTTLANDIADLGHKTWFDQQLTGGQAWWDHILVEIRECDIFCFLLAPESLNSHACKLELDYASKLHKTILPILIASGVSINLLPPTLSAIQYVDYRYKDKQAILAFFKALNNLPIPQTLPDPLPQPPDVPISYLGNLIEQIETTKLLSFEEQTALLLKLEESSKEVSDANEVHNVLERLRKRDDLFAKVADKVDILLGRTTKTSSKTIQIPETKESQSTTTPASNITQSEGLTKANTEWKEWRVELVSSGTFSRLFKVYLTHDTHMIEFNANWIFPGGIVKVDDLQVSESSSINHEVHVFKISDGSVKYDAMFEIRGILAGKLRLKIDNHVLYKGSWK